jgi:hypothetical protein
VSSNLRPTDLIVSRDKKCSYGATIRFYADWEEEHPLAEGPQFRMDFIQASSYEEFMGEEVPCLIGAFYVVNKAWYNHIGGWDTSPSVPMRGHQHWGALEPWISLKSWLAGGSVRVISDLLTGHVYHRLGSKADILKHRGIRADYKWYNKLFVIETMFSKAERDSFMAMVEYRWKENNAMDRNYALAERLIRQNRAVIDQVTANNDTIFAPRNLFLFKIKFNINTYTTNHGHK